MLWVHTSSSTLVPVLCESKCFMNNLHKKLGTWQLQTGSAKYHGDHRSETNMVCSIHETLQVFSSVIKEREKLRTI